MCNLASTLSGCIEREISRVIIALPTSNKTVDIFEQTITGGFSSINTRLAIDTDILLANLIDPEDSKDFRKDYNCKVCYNIRLTKEKKRNKKES